MRLEDRTLPVENIDSIYAVRAIPSASVLVFVMKADTDNDQMTELHKLLYDFDITALIVSEAMLGDVRRIPSREIDTLMDALGEARQISVLPGIEEYLWAKKYGTNEEAKAARPAAEAELRKLGWNDDDPEDVGGWLHPTSRRIVGDGPPSRMFFRRACEIALNKQRIFRKQREMAQRTSPTSEDLLVALEHHPETAREVYEALRERFESA